MSKYENLNKNVQMIDVNDVLVEGETIIWQGKPKKSAYIFNKLFFMFPIALIWLILDGSILVTFLFSGQASKMFWFIIPFFALHLMPVWIWLGNALTANKNWQNTRYAVTDRRIIIESGFISMNYQSVYYKEITNVNLKVSFIDKLLKVGDIYFTTKTGANQAFLDIENAYTIYPKIQKVVLDMQTDIEFPNNLRPKENDGYNTTYNSKF